MARPGRAETHKVATAQLVERAQKVMLIGEPSLVLGDNRLAIAVAADDEAIAPSDVASSRPTSASRAAAG